MLFRLRWCAEQVGNYRSHVQALENPFALYATMLLKLWPLYRGRLTLKLKQGGLVPVYEFMTLYIYTEIFVDQCYDHRDALPKAPLIVDIGANTGLFALRMKQLYPDARLVCFEPYAPNHEKLRETVRANNLRDVTLRMQGVGEESGRVKLYVHPSNIGGHSINPALASSEAVDIEVVSLQQIAAELGKPCDLLKLDCEGAEEPIIRSLTRDVAPSFPRIVFEATHQVYDPNSLKTCLDRLGYEVTSSKGLYWAQLQRQS